MLHFLYLKYIVEWSHLEDYLWISVFFFALQLLLCFFIERKKWLKLIPVFLMIEELIVLIVACAQEHAHYVQNGPNTCLLFLFYGVGPSDLFLFIALSTLAIIFSWIIYGIVRLISYCCNRKK